MLKIPSNFLGLHAAEEAIRKLSIEAIESDDEMLCHLAMIESK